jgi:lambda repressor-like predicted transcriptional regulator
MKPLDIRIALMRAGVRQTDIAAAAGVTPGHVACVLDRKSKSDRVQRLIAKALEMSVEQVFPDIYVAKPRAQRVRERLAS